MVGRREKQMPHQTTSEDVQHNTSSKFRRKLSHGLALISLAQRKSVSGRQLSSNTSLAVSAPSTNDSSTAILDHDALLSPEADSASVDTSLVPSAPSQDGVRASEDLQTPRQLPRSRTFSYIPRPVKLDVEAPPAAGIEEAIDTSLDTVIVDPNPHLPSRIPTPSPPQSKRRGSSPRQYLPHNSPLQARNVENRQSFMGIGTGSPYKTAIRSRTTPNLVGTINTTQSVNYMAPRRPGLKRPFASSTAQKPVLPENVPTNKRVAQRRSQTQDKAVKRESLAVPSAASNRRSFGSGAPLVQSKRASITVPATASKRLSAHMAQASMTLRRVSPNRQEGSPCTSEGTPVAQPQLMGPKSPPTPTSSDNDLTQPLLPPPRLSADNGTQRRTLGTPNGLGGVWRSSKIFAAANHQVRRLPRSSTFHHFGRRWEAPPPVPPIPNEYKSPSSPNSTHVNSQQYASPSLSNLRHRFPMSLGKFGSSSKSLLAEIALAQKSSEVESLKSLPTFVSLTASEAAEKDNKQHSDKGGESQNECIATEHRPCGDSVRTKASFIASNDATALRSTMETSRSKDTGTSISTAPSRRVTGDISCQRHWFISESFYSDSANNVTRVQVKDYMPPLYWAGRFQSRFDQWRTEAMIAVLNPEHKHEDEGPLGQCSLEDEKKATILIFMQLRDLCASTQAADSLHVCLSSS